MQDLLKTHHSKGAHLSDMLRELQSWTIELMQKERSSNVQSEGAEIAEEVEASITSNVKFGELMFAKNKENGTKIRKIYGQTLEAMKTEQSGRIDPQVVEDSYQEAMGELTNELRAAQKKAREASSKSSELQKEVERITNEHTSFEKQWGKRRKQLEDELTDSHYQIELLEKLNAALEMSDRLANLMNRDEKLTKIMEASVSGTGGDQIDEVDALREEVGELREKLAHQISMVEDEKKKNKELDSELDRVQQEAQDQVRQAKKTAAEQARGKNEKAKAAEDAMLLKLEQERDNETRQMQLDLESLKSELQTAQEASAAHEKKVKDQAAELEVSRGLNINPSSPTTLHDPAPTHTNPRQLNPSPYTNPPAAARGPGGGARQDRERRLPRGVDQSGDEGGVRGLCQGGRRRARE